MKYIAFINSVHKEDGMKKVLHKEIIEKDSKELVKKYLLEEYPTLFPTGKVQARTSKKDTEQIVYVTLNELDDYWENFWLTPRRHCNNPNCKNLTRRIDIDLNNVNKYNFYCDETCQKEHTKAINRASEDYWNNRCKNYYIYKITHKETGKVYIGSTGREVIFRWWEHFKHSKQSLGKALQEEGIDKFIFEVIKTVSKEDITDKERYDLEDKYIREYDAVNTGYNDKYNNKNN